MASKRPGEDENNGHAAAGDGPDAKKSKSVREPARQPLALLCSRAWVSSLCNDPERQGAAKGILLSTELLDLVKGLVSSHILRLRAKGSRWSCALHGGTRPARTARSDQRALLQPPRYRDFAGAHCRHGRCLGSAAAGPGHIGQPWRRMAVARPGLSLQPAFRAATRRQAGLAAGLRRVELSADD